jgi:WD40 repeat protein
VQVGIVDIENGQISNGLGEFGNIGTDKALTISYDGAHIAAFLTDNLRVWDLAKGEVKTFSLPIVSYSNSEGIITSRGLAWRPFTTQIAACGRPKTIYLLDSASGEIVQELPINLQPIQLNWSPDGGRLAIISEDRKGEIIDLETGYAIVLQIPDGFKFDFVEWSFDGQFLAAFQIGFIVWDTQTGKVVFDWGRENQSEMVTDIDWSNKDPQLAAITSSGNILLWQTREQESLKQFVNLCPKKEGDCFGWKITWSPHDDHILASFTCFSCELMKYALVDVLSGEIVAEPQMVKTINGFGLQAVDWLQNDLVLAMSPTYTFYLLGFDE